MASGLAVHSVSNHPTVPMIAWGTLPLSCHGLPGLPGPGFTLNARGSPNGMAESEFTCITDWTFTSGCSVGMPPRGDAVCVHRSTGRRARA